MSTVKAPPQMQANSVVTKATSSTILRSYGDQAPKTYIFGPFRISSGEQLLRRHQEIVSLPPMVVTTLLVLLHDAGALVTKEKLLEEVWGGLSVDPNGLPQNIFRLRKALDADFPESVISTVPRRGYRFVAAVMVESAAPVLQPVVPEQVTLAWPEPTKSLSRPYYRLSATLLLVLIAAALTMAWTHVWRTMSVRQVPTAAQPALTVRPAVAILGFDDLNGASGSQNAWIATALEETLYSELGAASGVRLVPNGAVAAVRKDLGLTRITTLSTGTLAAVRKSLGCDLLVVGHYLISDGQLRLDVVLEDARTGETVGSFTRTDKLNRLLPIIADSGQALRSQLGTPALDVAQTQAVRAAEAGQPQALRAYAEGMAQLRVLDAVAAQHSFEHAVQIEPDYSLAHSGLATAWSLLGYDAQAIREAQKAVALASDLSPEQRLEVQAQLHTVSGKWDEAVTAERALVKAYPDTLRYGLDLASALNSAGKPRESLAVAEQMAKLPAPAGDDPRIALAEAHAYAATGDNTHVLLAAGTAIAVARERQQRFVLAQAIVAHGEAMENTGQHKQARADFAAAKSVAESDHNPALVARILQRDADSLRATGDLDPAREELEQAIATAQSIGDRRIMIDALNTLTQIYRREGDLPAQKQLTLRVMELARETGNQRAQGNAYLDLGNELNNMGDPASCRKAYQRGLEVARQIGDLRMQSRALGNQGIVQYTHGQLAAGHRDIAQGLALSRSVGDTTAVAYKLGHFAAVLMYEGKNAEAQAALREKCTLTAKSGEKLDQANCEMSSAELARQMGDVLGSVPQLESIVASYKTVNPALNAWFSLARARMELHDLAGAQDAVNHATELAKHTVNESDFLIPLALIRGHLQTLQGNEKMAHTTLVAALARTRALGLVPLELEAQIDLAQVTALHDRKAARVEMSRVVNTASQLGYISLAEEAKGLIGTLSIDGKTRS
jgi:DNA-binding winged helix-turn-helix (wHTH) protein/tetratricopeptide (TPR) repeat protein